MNPLARPIALAVIGLSMMAGIHSFAAEAEEGFKPLFNGKDLSGWEGNPNFWSAKEGMIQGQTTAEKPTSGNTFLIWRAGTVDDFELKWSFRMVGGNSGIQYRSKDLGNFVMGGYQADFEAGDTYSGILYEERGARGIMGERGQKVEWDVEGKKHVLGSVGNSEKIQAGIKKEGWNDYHITVQGNHMIHRINGLTTVDVVDNDPKHQVFSGLLGLQLHAGPPMLVQFKDLRIKRTQLTDNRKKIVLVAGTPSHGKGDHEFNAGVQLLHKALTGVPGILSTYYLNGWPKDVSAFDNADEVLIYSDGGGGHPAVQGQHLAELDKLADQGVGMAFAHYGVEVPKDRGGKEFLKWAGGYFEEYWSVNPTWEADITSLPKHEVTLGVKPFKIMDEWYYNMRFREGMKGVTPVLTATPPDSTRAGKNDAHGGNDFVRGNKGRAEHLAWVSENPNGQRGFGFTGGHYHKNWGDDNFRKLVLNALVWTAHGKVPADGVNSAVTADELSKNLDPK